MGQQTTSQIQHKNRIQSTN